MFFLTQIFNMQARYYSTKFEPPKKVKKETKDLSENIKKFLAKKEAEEQKKREEDNKKKDELLALRAQVFILIYYLYKMHS